MLRRENILISEDYMSKTTSATHFTAPGEIECFDSSIHFGKESDRVEIQNCNIKSNVWVHCSKNDTYDFETGALIALMKMCGREKALKAVEELYNLKEPRGADLDGDILESKAEYMAKEIKRLTNVSEGLYNFNSRLIDEIDQKNHEIISLKALKLTNESLKKENEKLKLDYEKLQHGYCDMVKPELPRTLDINGTKYRKMLQIKDYDEQISKLTVDSLIEENRAFTKKCIDEWLYKPPTKREEMWENITEASKNPPVDIKVAKQDIKIFLKELEDKIPNVEWNGSDCLPTEYTNPYWFKSDYIYFALINYNKDGQTLKLCYNENKHSWINKTINYLPPLRWDLFKKGRIVVGVRKEHYDEFISNATKIIGTFLKHKPYDFNYTFFMYNKDSIFINSIGRSQFRAIKEMNNHKVYYWEDVR